MMLLQSSLLQLLRRRRTNFSSLTFKRLHFQKVKIKIEEIHDFSFLGKTINNQIFSFLFSDFFLLLALTFVMRIFFVLN
jgi:hypothetical protein